MLGSRHQLEKRVGRGGMGSVWLASRNDGVKVAVKLVKRGMDTAEILRRFRMERQVLASLDHPNIARLIDGGSTPEGMPYLAMEYVEGTPIDQFCESRASTISDRLKLFRDILPRRCSLRIRDALLNRRDIGRDRQYSCGHARGAR